MSEVLPVVLYPNRNTPDYHQIIPAGRHSR